MPQGLRLASGAYRSYARQSFTDRLGGRTTHNSQPERTSPQWVKGLQFRVGGFPLIDTQSSQLCFEPQKLLGQKS